MPRHVYRARVNAPVDACLRCVLDPEAFLSASRYTYSVKRLDEGKYEVVFRWRKFGVERFYPVRVRVERRGGRVVYEPTPDSPHNLRLEISVERDNGGALVTVDASMDAGLLARIMGRGDFAAFVEDLVDKGIAGMAERAAAKGSTLGGVAHCERCLLYDPGRGYCYALRREVGDPGDPPCRGRFFIDKSLA